MLNEISPSLHLRFAISDGVASLEFNRPERHNALTFAMYRDVARLCSGLVKTPDVRVLVVSGVGGRAFAAGTDISELATIATVEDAFAYEAMVEEAITALERCEVPTIAAIGGVCTGGGAVIAAACDLRIAAPNLRFGHPMARTTGNCLSVANCTRLAALIGVARVKEMLLTARLIDSAEAKAVGLISETVAEVADLSGRAAELARSLASHAPLTMRATKEGLRRVQAAMHGVEQCDLLSSCYGSDDFREGTRAFLEKRKPGWRGR